MGGRAPGLLAKRLLNQALVASTTWNMATRTCVSVDHGDSQAAVLGSERVPQLRAERGGGLLEELGCLSGGVQGDLGWRICFSQRAGLYDAVRKRLAERAPDTLGCHSALEFSFSYLSQQLPEDWADSCDPAH